MRQPKHRQNPLPGADTVHGTLVARQGEGVLLCGPSGAGKSDLALRLLGGGWQLVADDRVLFSRSGDSLIGAPPATIAGLLEVRGVGIVTVPFLPSARLTLIVDWAPLDDVPRLPESTFRDLLGVQIPTVKMHFFDVSAVQKLEILLKKAVSG